jgi:hypothetical protein
MSYRKKINKIYNKIETIARKGPDYVLEYNQYIDSIIKQGNYSILQDVMSYKYNLDMRIFNTIEDFKRTSFPAIRFNSISRFQKRLKSILDQQNIYCVGIHFYDSNNDRYLGDIREIEEQRNFKAYEDQELIDEKATLTLEATKGLSSSINDATPVFSLSPNDTITFKTHSVVQYLGGLYTCNTSYTWNLNNQITPTFSQYWGTFSYGTFSTISYSDDETELLDKYTLAIDWLLNRN